MFQEDPNKTAEIPVPLTYSFRFDHELNLVIVDASGTVTLADEIKLLQEIVASPGYRVGMNSLCDMTHTVIEWNLAEIDEFREYLKLSGKRLGARKWALLSADGVTPSTVKLFMILMGIQPSALTVRLFTSKGDAMRWLSE